MTDEEQKADCTSELSIVLELIKMACNSTASDEAKLRFINDTVDKTLDAMMEQRKARMG